MRSKLISCVLAIAMLLTLSVPAFATDSQVSEYTFSDNVINAEVSDNGIQSFTSENIIVMTEAEALELGTGLRSIVQNCQLVYIDGDVNPVTIANSAGIPVPGEAVADSNDNTVKDIALAIKYVDGDFIIDEIAIKSNNLNSLLVAKAETIMMDGIKAALVYTPDSEVVSDGPQTRSLPVGYDKYSNKDTTVYDNNNKAIGTLRFNARYYNRGSWTSGQMFDTIVKATFAPESGYYVKKVNVTLGHLKTDSAYAQHEIIDETYIPSQDTSSTIDVGLDASAEGVGGSVGASLSYTSEAINVTNDFTEDDSRIWTFEPVKARSGNALVQEPGIRSVSSGSGKKYTSIKLNCPFYGPLGIIFKNNNLYWHIAW